ncbi:two-component system, LytT family, sensor histidine kinase LytS [Thermoanaerobacter thermohydrosulfuricus]|uniref:histidine kinase n=2 Tax=Thermoanaerobacter thermohydrosulfuricus TaxID=1516 RepID=M8CWC6_THETY|nr:MULTISPECIES: sensor histidine kinase [Thermoanaerobacter]EMT38674.1 Putative regulator of cell autolysis [Thermoanaerobacter thermohydrosulfuricus WC1]UZQ83825.1 sensor histidine kinase [Thermoanaerobacter sp. RKWS2]SDF49045.1 two-component system, LytT family, sensor histidine kinase LytS [Thermoanaerobacter thermohydrosulfuricus]
MYELLIILAERFSIIALLAFVLSKAEFFKKIIYNSRVTKKDLLLTMVIFGVIGIAGTYVGVPIKDAIANSRVVGPMVAGLIGGPLVGLGAGLIAGVHRFFLGGFTAMSCGVSTILEGFSGGLIRKYYKGEHVPWELAFVAGFIGEAVQMLIILTTAKPFSQALELVDIIGLPMMIVNATGIAIFMIIIKSVFDEKEQISAMQAKIALEIASKTLPYLRKGLNEESAQKTAEIIYNSTNVSAVTLTDKKKILAHVGIASDHHKPGTPVLTKATKEVLKTRKIRIAKSKEEIGCSHEDCPLSSAVIVPLFKYDKVVGTLKLYKGGNKSRNNVISNTEIELAKGLGHLISYQLEIADAEYQRKLATEAKLNALQAQINPHFLFNALNTVISFIRTKPDEARALLINLSEYFRHNLKNVGKYVTIEQELNNINAYLYIEKARFGDKLNIEQDIDESVLSYYMPSFTLQPIVENAVKHGILPKGDGGTIKIKIKDKVDYISFCVEDDGIGIKQEDQQNLLRKGFGNGAGIGLYNVNERLTTIFCKECSLVVKSEEKIGTKVSFKIPKSYLKRDDVYEEIESVNY